MEQLNPGESGCEAVVKLVKLKTKDSDLQSYGQMLCECELSFLVWL